MEEGRGIFETGADLGTPTVMIEMLLHSRPGNLELLPALPGGKLKPDAMVTPTGFER